MSESINLPDPESIPLPEEAPKSQDNNDEVVETEEEKEMAKLLGFSKFDTTKGKKVPGNQVGAVRVIKKRRYRQYMNRKGGFNRPLDKVA